MRTTLTLLAALGLLCTTPGCAAMVVGYLVGDAISSNEKVKACRENLRIVNEQRLRDGKDLFPDQCGK